MPQGYSPNTTTAVQVAQLNVNENIRISQPPVGVLECVNLKFDSKNVSKNDVVTITVDPVGSLEDVQPGATPPAGASTSLTNIKVRIQALRQKSRVLTGEDILQFENQNVKDDLLRQFLGNGQMLLRGEMDASAGQALHIAASRATGTAGITPFSRDLSSIIDARQILRDNGDPWADVSLVTNTKAYSNILKQNVIQQAQQAGSDMERRTGYVQTQFGTTKIVEDSYLKPHLGGVGAAYTLNGGVVVGQTIIPLTGGAATDYILYGDVLTIAGDTNQYIAVAPVTSDTTYPNSVNSGSFVTNQPYTIESLGTTNFVSIGAASNTVGTTFVATGAGGGTGTATVAGYLGAAFSVTIGNPGIRQITSTGAAVTNIGAYTPSYLFEKSSVVGIVRPPAGFSTGGYIAASSPVTDAFGYTYNFIESNQWGQWSWFLQLAWGFADIQSEYNSLILG